MLHDFVVVVGWKSNDCGNNIILLTYIFTTVGWNPTIAT